MRFIQYSRRQHEFRKKISPLSLAESKIHAAFLTTTDEFLPVNDSALRLYEIHYKDLLRLGAERRYGHGLYKFATATPKKRGLFPKGGDDL